MAVYDLGDVVALGITITDANGNPANATNVTATITQPDGSTSSPSVVNSSTGNYDINFTPQSPGRYTIRWVATGANASAYADEFSVRDYAKTSIVSLDEVKAHLNIASNITNLDEELRRFIDAATDLCENQAGRVLGRAVITNEIHQGNTDVIRLNQPTAISVTAVYENGILLPANAYQLDRTGQYLYRLTAGALNAPNYFGVWAPGANAISISYVAGFTNPPSSAKQAVLEEVRHLWQTQRGTASSARNQSGDEYDPRTTYSMPRRVIELLDPVSIQAVI